MNTREARETMELDSQDGIVWRRDINAPIDAPWCPADGENGMTAKTKTEAARVLRQQGYRVTRRRSGR